MEGQFKMWKIRNWMRFLHPVHAKRCVWLQAASWFVRRATWDLCLRHGVGDILSIRQVMDDWMTSLSAICTNCAQHFFIKQLFCIAQWFSKLCHVRPLSSGSLIPDLHSTALQAIYFITELALAADPADFEALYGISIPEPSLPGAPFRRRVSACLHVSGSCW